MAGIQFPVTKVRVAFTGFLATVVGLLSGSFVDWLASVDVTWLKFAVPGGLVAIYYVVIALLEKKFPWFAKLFGQVPTPAPAPTPVTPPTPSTFVETDKGVWAADVNAMEKANEVTKTPPTPTAKPKQTPKTKR